MTAMAHALRMDITITKIIGDRADLKSLLGLDRRFVDTWTAKGSGDIPMMPHIPDIGNGLLFHLGHVEAWLLEYFERGGTPMAAPIHIAKRKLRR
jgi:hypothetical protein